MNILMVGDVYGEPGRQAVAKLVPRLRQEHAIDFCVVNIENAAAGFGSEPLAHADVVAAGEAAAHTFERLIRGIVPRIAAAVPARA